ncbi:MAG TPA: hypothetical protein VHV08_09705 [Pirellulales bacterium]|jgi:sRNA-binding protein|nr:hypothetical protein [Pirellulales bacterium]
MVTRHAFLVASGVAVLALGLLSTQASAQMMVPNGMSGQQLQSMMYMRAMQGYGRGGVRTGYPQNIPLGDPGGYAPDNDDGSANQQSTTKQKVEARKAREEQKRAAREGAKNKKAKAAKKPVKKEAQAAKKPVKKNAVAVKKQNSDPLGEAN